MSNKAEEFYYVNKTHDIDTRQEIFDFAEAYYQNRVNGEADELSLKCIEITTGLNYKSKQSLKYLAKAKQLINPI